MPTLYLVATPIGNLEDMSPRAVRVLREVSLVAAEDTRRTRKLFAHFDIHSPLISYFEHNKLQRLNELLSALDRGDVAVVSDAGTPGLNDPGFEVIRAAIARGHRIVPIPGPAAPIAALVASGLPTDGFVYLGFLPRRAAARRALLRAWSPQRLTLVALEAPSRLNAALRDIEAVLGQRPLAVARELTKLHEEIFRGTPGEAREHFQASPVRGEVTLIVQGRPRQAERWSPAQVSRAVRVRLGEGLSPARISAEVAKASGWERRVIYDMTHGQKAQASARPPGKHRTPGGLS
jgi:16S rRNA (cytidine1402-2'-O)-methyltransferase